MSTYDLDFDIASLPEGWFTAAQIHGLYDLAMATAGPILEVGPWVGRSTSVICRALARRRDEKIEFHTVDYGISSEEEWERLFGSPVRNKHKPERYLRHINQAGGTIASLKRNLEAQGLRDHVTIHKGDFHAVAPDGPFGLIFCDATHNRREIDKNVPALLERLVEGGVLACDDINDELFEHLSENYPFRRWVRHELLCVGYR
ncbi:class I SAM-dependent methyltransferase [Parvularcula oceani]|uniref:class I SAM-dependent methyltransferase n=1 Tax=Parvularcula oceani TaxID=1247963 RepID=UPI0004E1EC65|nr:class I SAM-dependent methyltransferase [Parvularcula oceani]